MKLRTIPFVLSTLNCLYGPMTQYYYEEIFKATDSIWIKNLNITAGTYLGRPHINKVIMFDIIFHTTSIDQKIFAHIRASDENKANRPNFELDYRKGNTYQRVELDLDDHFINYIADNTVLRVTYGDKLLFQFSCPAYLRVLNYVEYTMENFPDVPIFKNEVKYPAIKNGQVVSSFTETINLTKTNLKKIRNFWYGKFPDEYLWLKFDTDQFRNVISGEELMKVEPNYAVDACVYFYQKDLFKDYHPEFTNLNNTYSLNDYFTPMHELDGFWHLGYKNEYGRVTFLDGTMRIKSELNEYVLRTRTNKNSKFITFPLELDEFEKNYELAKNMKMIIIFRAGLLRNFNLSITMNLDLRRDFFYNHLDEITLKATHNQDELDTVDYIYA